MATAQLERTIGTVYGEVMRDSEISLPNARYVTGSDFVSGLRNNGVTATRSEIFKELERGLDWGINDNVTTGIQELKYVGNGRGYANPQRTTFVFNPWKELTGRDPTVKGYKMSEIFHQFLTGGLKANILMIVENFRACSRTTSL